MTSASPRLPDHRLPDEQVPDFDLDDDALRAAGTAKWRVPPAGVIGAWVAEMDVAPCPAVLRAVHKALDVGRTGYPDLSRGNGLGEATTDLLSSEFGWSVDPDDVVATGDVMAGVRLALETLCEPGPVVVPVPTYPPFLAVVPLTGRPLVTVPMAAAVAGAPPTLDLDALGAALAAGARTVLLSSPHNPSGRAFTRPELTALLEVVARYGARVISDEIHAPLVLERGRGHVPFASLDGAGDLTVTVVAASKAWNIPGLKCAQIVTSNAGDRRRLRELPHVANAGASPLGIVASVAAYRDGRGWLQGVREHLRARRDQLAALLAQRLPGVVWAPPEATYLAWLDVSAYAPGSAQAEANGWDAAAAALSRGGVMLSRGQDFAAPSSRTRLNFATSPERLERIVEGLVDAWV